MTSGIESKKRATRRNAQREASNRQQATGNKQQATSNKRNGSRRTHLSPRCAPTCPASLSGSLSVPLAMVPARELCDAPMIYSPYSSERGRHMPIEAATDSCLRVLLLAGIWPTQNFIAVDDVALPPEEVAAPTAHNKQQLNSDHHFNKKSTQRARL